MNGSTGRHPGNQVKVYPGTPPLAVTFAVPLFPPKQLTSVVVIFGSIKGGCVISGLVVASD